MSPMHYRLTQNLSVTNRWYLQAPVTEAGITLDPRIFVAGEWVAIDEPLRIGVRQVGVPLDFTLADFEVPVVRKALGVALQAIVHDHIQRIPIKVDGEEGDFEILNVLKIADSLDHARSTITYWAEADRRPDKIGQPRMIIDLTVDPSRAAGSEIFRLLGWRIALIVSDRVAEVLKGWSGVQLEPVTLGT